MELVVRHGIAAAASLLFEAAVLEADVLHRTGARAA